MKKRIRISIIILVMVLVFCTVFCGCSVETPPSTPLWIAVKSVGGDNGLFAEGQDYSFTLCFGHTSSYVQDCRIAVITATNINNDTTEEETQTFLIDNFGDVKYHKPYEDTAAPSLELSYSAPTSQPCTGGIGVEVVAYKDEAAYIAGEKSGSDECWVHYLSESGVGTIVSYKADDILWERRCNILLAEGKLTKEEYNSEMKKLQQGPFTVGHWRGVSSGWAETGLSGGGDVSFIETADDSGIVTGMFSASTDNETVTVSYITQLDSGWYDIRYGSLYFKYKQVFSLTVETENGVETRFVLYNNGKLTLSRPVSGWCSGHVNNEYIIVTDSQDGGTETYYELTDDMSLPELEDYNY